MRHWRTSILFAFLLAALETRADRLAAYRPRFEEAERLYRLERFDEAIAQYASLAADLPEFPLAHIGFAQTAFRMGDYRRAEAAYARALELAPDDARIMGELGDACRMNRAYGEAEAWYGRALETAVGTERAEWLIGLGLVASQRGSVETARARFAEAVESDPESSAARHNLGVALLNMNRCDEADAAFRTALEREPKNAKAVFGRGRVAEKNGKLFAARDFYTRATELAPNEAAYQYARATALLRLRQTELANQAFARYRRVRADLYLQEAHRLVTSGRFRDALAKAQKAYEADADYPDAARTRAYVQARLGEWDAASAGYERLLRLAPGDVDALFHLGLIDIERARYADAERRFLAALERSPEYGAAYRQLARARELAGDIAGATAAYDLGINQESG